MRAPSGMQVVNRLIAMLPRRARERLLAQCEPTELVFGTVLCKSGQPFRDAYFPLTGFISLIAEVDRHPPLELGLIGNEGMLGATAALGIDIAPLSAIVQGSGTALRISRSLLRRELRDSRALRVAVDRYLYVVLAQLAQTAACTCFHEVEARLTRWLLMSHDRAHADRFHLTHQFLADMLGVRRSAVTIAAGALQRRHLIRYTRGEISILDRRGLELASCACYRVTLDTYAQLFD